MPKKRKQRNYFPSSPKVLALLLKCFPMNGGNFSEGGDFATAFRDAVKTGTMKGEVKICGTPLRWIAYALACSFGLNNDSDRSTAITQLRSVDDMFMKHGSSSEFLSEFILMDVICNRKITPTAAAALGKSGSGTLGDNDVVMAPASEEEDLDDVNDFFKYRTLLAFLPGVGVFYAVRDWRRKSEGVDGSRIAMDISWFRLKTGMEHSPQLDLQFGEDGMPPDLISGHDVGVWPVPDRAQEYNRRLVNSNSTRVGGRHYAPGCLHLNIPDTCWIVDPEERPFVDIIVDIAPPVSSTIGRKSVIMIRSILDASLKSQYCHLKQLYDVVGCLDAIVEHNSLLRRHVSVGTARQNKGDVGTMHAIVTRVLLDGSGTVGYATNYTKVPQTVLKRFIVAFATVGMCCFPDVLSVVQHMEANSSLPPIAPMGENDCNGIRVGYTIDMSVDLGNVSHFDVNDASQGFSVWTEEMPGCASNWYLIFPNLHGRRPCGTKYNGIAVKLYHGTAISWDGRAVRHCTSVSRPDGPGTAPVRSGGGCWNGNNHLYGTFTAAKEKIVAAGRCRASGNSAAADVVTNVAHSNTRRPKRLPRGE
ncbi:hypothetical protein MHU86_8410 [Fragilaria crotonensis]|nr:hypothetical protein MHU86_8410 [Fragilaria crotonensis]